MVAPMPDMFDLVEIVPGVHGIVSDITGGAVGNAAIIDTGEQTIVIDTLITARAAAELRTEAVRLTGRSAALVVNTHWHSDHTWGNQVFADTPIIGTARTLELMITDAPADLGAYEAEIDGALTALRAQLQSDAPEVRALAARRIAGMEHLKAAAPGFRLTLPAILFEDRLVIAGERRVELHTFGPGHTDSDVFAWLPDDKVVLSGDLCWNGIHPKTSDGHPAAWADSVERLLAFHPTRIHPGHGESGDHTMAETIVPYLRAIAAYVDEVRTGADPSTLPAPAGSEDWDGLERMRAGVQALARRAH